MCLLVISLKLECCATIFLFFCFHVMLQSAPESDQSICFPSSTVCLYRELPFLLHKSKCIQCVALLFFFLKRGLKIIIMYLYLLFLTPPQNHSVQTTSRPTLSGKSRFRKKGDTIDSTTYKKENIMSQTDTLWDVAGC